MCVRSINIRCNNITQYENLMQQQCFKRACVTLEQHVHSFQQVSHEKLFDIEAEKRLSTRWFKYDRN